MLEVKNVTKNFGDLVAVNELSFNVTPGEIYGLLGTNGAGKTTTFRMILGLLTPTKGEVLYKGKKIDYDVTDEIGFLVEERALLTKLTVEEMIEYYGRLKSLTSEVIKERLTYWLDRLSLSEVRKKKIKELSKGMQQKVQFISAIIHEPKLLILDEPFSGLDPLNIEIIIEIIREFQKKGTIIIFSTHRIDHVELFCEQLTVLVKGKSVISGNIEQIKDDFKRKTVKVSSKDLNIETVKNIEGVVKIQENLNEFVISVAEESYATNIFNYVKTLNNVTKYSVEKPSLSEIFIEKVGEAYNA